MRITDDPDEDADNLDDEALLEAYLGTGTAKPDPGGARNGAAEIPDWPPMTTREVGVPVDQATLGWFCGNHADWRREMSLVLRAWVAAQPTIGQIDDTPGEAVGG